MPKIKTRFVKATQHHATQRNATQRNATQRKTQRNATQRSTPHHNTCYNTTQRNTLQHNTTHAASCETSAESIRAAKLRQGSSGMNSDHHGESTSNMLYDRSCRARQGLL